MDPHLEVLARVLVLVRRADDRVAVPLGRQGHGSLDAGVRALHRLDDLRRRLVEDLVVVGLEPDPDLLAGALGHPRYFRIFVTRPEPTVRPPSRIAKRSPSTMAMGLPSSTVMSVLSPGMTISVPLGSWIDPVTSVVRK